MAMTYGRHVALLVWAATYCTSGAAAFIVVGRTARESITTPTSAFLLQRQNHVKETLLSMQPQANHAAGGDSSASPHLTHQASAPCASPLVGHAAAHSPVISSTSLSSTVVAAAECPSLATANGFGAAAADIPDILGLLSTDNDRPIVLTGDNNGWNLKNPSVIFARVLILAAAAVYGTNFSMVKLLDDQMPYQVSAVLRFGLAAAVVTALVLQGEKNGNTDDVPNDMVGKTSSNNNNTWLSTFMGNNMDHKMAATLAGAEIGGWYCLGYLAQAIGLETADASKSAFFNALAVIVVPLLDSALKGRQLGPQAVLSIVLAILGVGLLQLGPHLMAGGLAAAASLVSHGDIFCLGQALLFGIGYWRLETVAHKYPTEGGRLTVGQLGGVALGSTVFAAAMGNVPTLAQLSHWLTDPFVLGALLWTALVSTALALYLETVALKAVSASELTILMTSVSLFGSAFAYVTMGEIMAPLGMAGGLLILGGCLVSALGGSDTTTGSTITTEAPALWLEPDEPTLLWQNEFGVARLEEQASVLPEQLLAYNSTTSIYR